METIKMSYVVNNCCFCVELRTGSLIIGYLRMVGTLLIPLLMIIDFKAVCEALGVILPPEHSFLVLFIVLFSAYLIVNLIFNILLLVGLHQEKAKYVRHYLMFSVIIIALSCITFIFGLTKSKTAIMAVKNIFSILIQLYFLLVIRSHYVKMDNQEISPAVLNTA